MQSAFLSGQAVGRRAMVSVAPRRSPFVVESAHKKGAGSTKNGRDSQSKRRGVKVYGGQPVKAGGIIVRQVGTTWHAGDNTGLGKDYTLYSLVDGVVVFDQGCRKDKPQVHVFPMEHAKAKAEVAKTHTKPAAEGMVPRAALRKAAYIQRSGRAAATTVGVATVSAAVRP
jgi:large subunit ribosomal protein L27